MTRFQNNDSDVVVVIGSGAGGGTLANELCQAGVRVVCLEAGPHLTGPDYHNDEWPAFQQMAWTDMRTTSGSWRVATDFPNLPAWTVKAVGGTSTHWAGACPRFKDYEFTAQNCYGAVEGASLLDWPITLADLAPYYDNAEIRMGVTHRHGRPPLPANNNYKVLANGAAKVGYKQYATGPYATNATPYDGRPASNQDGFNFQGDKTGAKWSTLVAELPKAEKTGNLDLRPGCHVAQITHDAKGKVDGVLYFEGEVLHRQAARVVCVAANAIESARLLLLSGSRGSATAWPTPPARSARTTCATSLHPAMPASSTPCTCIAVRRWPGSSPTRPAWTSHAGSSGATTWRPCRSARPSSPPSPTAVRGGRPSPRSWTATKTPPVCGSWARTCRSRPTG
jgi:choline dehydrogenase-like flavoprotein